MAVEFEGEDRKWFDSLAGVDSDEAQGYRVFLLSLNLEGWTPLKRIHAEVMEAMSMTVASARGVRKRLQDRYELVVTRRNGRSFEVSLTDRGVDFVNWILRDSKGQQWGIDGNGFLSAEEKRRYEEAFIRGKEEAEKEGPGRVSGGLVEIEGGIVQWELGEYGLVLDEKVPRSVWHQIMTRVKKAGFRTAFVPPGYEIVALVMEETRLPGGKVVGKRKAKRVLRWSDFPVVDREVILGNAEYGFGSEEDSSGDTKDTDD